MPPKKATTTAAKAKAAPKSAAATTKAKTTKAAPTKAAAKTDAKPAATTKRAAANAAKKTEEEEAAASENSDVEDAPAPKTKTKQTAAAVTKKETKTAAAKRKADESESDEKSVSPAPKKTKAAAAKKAAPAKKTAAAAAKKTTTTTRKKTAAPTSGAGESDKENGETAKPKANTKRKRAQSAQPDESDDEEQEARPKKQARKVAAPKPRKIVAPKPAPKRKVLKQINSAPTTLLDIFVFGEGSAGELGLGHMKTDGKKPIDVKRPRLNAYLNAQRVVQVSCGGMHAIALTQDNKILTWGVNDQGALGRDTTWDGGLRDVDEDSDSDEDEDDSGLNPKESKPAEVDTSSVEEDTKFVQVVACDSGSFALTEEGKVYGWGTFRANDGILGFTEDILIQKTPMLLPELKGITQLAAGANHVLALDNKGKVQAWGSGQQSQLARRVFEGHMKGALRPAGIGNLPIRGAKAAKVATGSYHSFVIDTEGRVFSWGLNSFGETGITGNAGEDAAVTQRPTHVESLSEYKIKDIAGGGHHSLACTEDGQLLTWGRIDGHQVGLPMSTFTDKNAEFDEHGKPRILLEPTVIEQVKDVTLVEAGTDNCFAVTAEGKAYSWGFSGNYQTGQGTDDDIEEPTLIDNTAVRERKLIWAGAGGQYSMVASAREAEA